MNNRAAAIAQAVRGPLLLITVGVLFAMHQAGYLSFTRSWPLLIIAIGLIKLIERLVAPPVPNAPPRGFPPAGGMPR